MTDHFPRPSARATSRQDRVAALQALCREDYAKVAPHRQQSHQHISAFLAVAPEPAPAIAPSDLDVAVSVAQQLLADFGDSSREGFSYPEAYGALRGSLRDLLRALGAEPNTEQAPAPRCPAAHPEDPTPCGGPVVVTVLDTHNAGANGCEHHAARLLASLKGGRVYALPDAPEGAAIRTFKAADGTRPFPWLTGAPRTEPSQRSHAENRARGEGQ
jgi:hypothetical protein